ncbi:MAG: XrtA/PEP-CTERM system histidine kinase PrsK [Gammaproteobacteria bacterium]
MDSIVIISYLVAALAFAGLATLLASSWRGGRTGALLIGAAAVSALWGGFIAFAAWRGTIAVSWLLLAEILRYGAWLGFMTALLGAWASPKPLRRLRFGVHILWPILALYCLTPILRIFGVPALPFFVVIPVIGVLVLALTGLVLIEQVYRNVQPEQRWSLKFLVIGLGAIFAYDIFLYSYAALYGTINPSAWAARGFINAVVAPLILVAAARNPRWSLQASVSRRVVFYSSSLLVVALYIIATAISGYYVRVYGGDWGRVAEITLICLALVVLLVVAFSGQARSRLRMFLHKNFFNFRHDYRDEWLRLTTALSAGSGDLALCAIQAIAHMMDSPAGALFMRMDSGRFAPAAHWNLPVPDGLSLSSNGAFFDFLSKRQWIYNFGEPPPSGDAGLVAPPELSALDRAWLLVPLVVEDRLIGFMVLANARARRRLDWEDIDLLRAAGRQVASTLAQAEGARRLAETRQFDGFYRLTAFMMHDLKNIAAQQSLLLQNAPRHKHNPAFVDDMLVTVENSVRRTNRLLEQLRGETVSGVRHRVHLAEVIEKAIAGCGRGLPQPRFLRPTRDLATDADAEQLAMVLGHLIRNAQEAASTDGHVEVRLCEAGEEARIEVEDDGVGMDEDFIRDRLFKPFYTTKASKGMGIGAYQAREYVRVLGGRVAVASTPGRGTVFSVFLPALAASEPVPPDDAVRAAS